jgi:hypothetical protein
MPKHPIDHDRGRATASAKVASEYARIERQQAGEKSDPKVRAMLKATPTDAPEADAARLRAFLKIEREQDDS